MSKSEEIITATLGRVWEYQEIGNVNLPLPCVLIYKDQIIRLSGYFVRRELSEFEVPVMSCCWSVSRPKNEPDRCWFFNVDIFPFPRFLCWSPKNVANRFEKRLIYIFRWEKENLFKCFAFISFTSFLPFSSSI